MTNETPSYEDFFRLAFFGKDAKKTERPFDYQERLADEILPELLNVPTGAGKTAAILGAWLWRRLKKPESVGRRLIYCLPMRTLVEQTRKVAEAAIKNLDAENRFSVHALYGGDVSDDWDIFPEREQIIIGTQDLLLSRALNRGYAMNRFRWAFHFGLFNNDCLWVFDEVQLFGDGLATTTQLAAMREKFKTFGNSKSIWMSATLDKDWLKTIDFAPQIDALETLSLSEADKQSEVLSKRLKAVKNLQKAVIECRLPKGLAEFVIEKHERETQTLIVVNTVQRAQEVFEAIEKLYAEAEKQAKKSVDNLPFENQNEKPEIKLLHSRFRPAERKEWKEVFEQFDENGNKKIVNRIIIATQVVEAGVDISSKLLITDLAPFSSLVQRFGRCNRNGEHERAEVFWIDLPLKEKDRGKDYAEKDFEKIDEKKLADILKPYETESLKKAKRLLESLESVSLTELETLEYAEPFVPNHVLRQRDLIDLFDTTADLSGFDLDVSRFVRGGEERDVSVFWLEAVEENIKPVKGTKKEKTDLAKMFAPHRDELCSVPIYDAKPFIDKVKKAWTFDALSGEWRETKSDSLRTGMIILLDAKNGGYDKFGWNPKSKKVIPVELPSAKVKTEAESNVEAVDDDNQTFETKTANKFISYTQTLKAHSSEVKQSAERILDSLKLSQLDEFSAQIASAAHHHDLGKAHEIFQATVQKVPKETSLKNYSFGELLAKAKSGGKHRRKKFRHELASALALIQRNRDLPETEKHSDLEIYLVAAHHGKVRLSIRALPDETKPFELGENDEYKSLDKKFARGIWDDDVLPPTNLGNGVEFPETVLNLDALTLGRSDGGESSWLERMLKLRDDLGVFRLAYLEAIVRAADVQASANPQDYKEKGETEL